MDVVLPLADGRLEVRTLRAPESFVADAASWLLVSSGAGSLTVDGATVTVPARPNLADAPGWSAMLAAGASVALTGDLVATLVVRPGAFLSASSILAPSDVVTEQRGAGPTTRTVRTYVASGPLICGETISPPGGWSSWPPHRHEHEEVYVYRFGAPDGFGVQVSYGTTPDGSARTFVVRDGHAERIVGDYHPVVAAPHSWLYYLWALAGASDVLTPEPDARYA